MGKHWAMESPRPKQHSHHRVFESDAPQASRVEFERVCDKLGFDMERAMCKEDPRTMIQARGGQDDIEAIRRIRLRCGLTKNAAILTAVRIGLSVLEDA